MRAERRSIRSIFNPAAATMPDHLIERGLAVLAASLVVLVIAQLHFSRFENKIPERI